MMARRGVLALLSGGLAALLGGCGSNERLRYKTTVEIDTPEGVRIGSAVREIVATNPPSAPMLGEDRGSIQVHGQAVAVDLPNGQTLFALLAGGDGNVDYAGRYTWYLFRDTEGFTTDGAIELWPKLPPARLKSIDSLPMLVVFRDLNDPRSIERVDPNNLAAHFGDGVSLRRIWLGRSSEKVTEGITERLPWLVNHRGSFDYTGRLHPNNPEKDLTASSVLKDAY